MITYHFLNLFPAILHRLCYPMPLLFLPWLMTWFNKPYCIHFLLWHNISSDRRLNAFISSLYRSVLLSYAAHVLCVWVLFPNLSLSHTPSTSWTLLLFLCSVHYDSVPVNYQLENTFRATGWFLLWQQQQFSMLSLLFCPNPNVAFTHRCETEK